MYHIVLSLILASLVAGGKGGGPVFDRVPCTTCGGSCSTLSAPNGVCTNSLICTSQTHILPACPKCTCGHSCTFGNGRKGVCQVNGVCGIDTPSHCPCVKQICPFHICLPPFISQAVTLANGCPGCSTCVMSPPPLVPEEPGQNLTLCVGNTFPSGDRCVYYMNEGDFCESDLKPYPRLCNPPLQCQGNPGADFGVCTDVCKPECPALTCEPYYQVPDPSIVGRPAVCPSCMKCNCPADGCKPCCPFYGPFTSSCQQCWKIPT